MPSLQVYNTLSRRTEPFAPLHPGRVSMYLCGPTVYDDCHIGHLMGPVLFDAVARWFRARGFAVRLVNNITDIDDKIINRSIGTGEPWLDITRRYTAQYVGYLRRLHVSTITDHPRCSDFIPQMVRYIADLIGTERAYVAGDGVYYDVQRQPAYGKLSGRSLEEMQPDADKAARLERELGLKHPADFALWKLAKPGEPSWDSPWGHGRPGWHIECSVMSTELLGDTFDIHAGGDDLKFPHHENEIAQGEAHGGKYACCWMHNGLIQYEGRKVGKSDERMQDPTFRRQFQADHLLDTYGAATVRFLLLQGHYRRPNDFAPSHLIAARTALARIHQALNGWVDQPGDATLDEVLARPLPESAAKHRATFVAAMDDDFNTGQAIAALFSLLAESRRAATEQETLLLLVRDLGRLIGLFQPGDARDTQPTTCDHAAQNDDLLAKVMALVLDLRQKARANRDFPTSDLIRDRLKDAGITVKDAKDGATWERAK